MSIQIMDIIQNEYLNLKKEQHNKTKQQNF